ncbi:tyrosine-protein phosphatase [Amphibacillus sp. Q70]|uniref:tyrosine-protein phosphatase n=1 Tax=Amphibacillus sp. Q70 TaxID=3453416 RepID=UPI003F854202
MHTVVNFRDLGGIANKAGKKVKSKRILRSGELVSIAKQDREQLISQYQLKKIIDLRGKEEVRKNPDDLFTGVEYLHIDVMEDIDKNTTSLYDLLKHANVLQVDKAMINVYEQLILDPIAQKGYQAFLQEMIKQEEGAVLFHCFAGKDRTGVGAALLLSLLEVDQELIFEDYLQTNRQRQQANQQILANFSTTIVDPEHKRALERALLVDRMYLESTFATIRKHYNSVPNYVKEALNIDLTEQAYLREKLLTS